jgi:ABC-type multidrug transport system permease subunit
LVERGWSPETKKALLAEFNKTQTLAVKAQQHFSLRPPPTGFAFTLPAYLVMFVMMTTMMYGGTTLIYERQGKQIHRLAASPVSFIEIFFGKMLGKMLQPILQGTILLLAGVFIFRISLGDHPTALLPVILSFAFFCGSAGLLFGLLMRSEQQVMGFGLLVSMVLAALGGCWWPLEVAPEAFKTVALFTPTYWAMQGLHDVLSFGKSWMGVLPECGILCALGVILTSISLPLFRID